jgi:hypothetical protein
MFTSLKRNSQRLALMLAIFALAFGTAIASNVRTSKSQSLWFTDVACPLLYFSYDDGEEYFNIGRPSAFFAGDGFSYVYQVTGPGGYFVEFGTNNPSFLNAVVVGDPGTYTITLYFDHGELFFIDSIDVEVDCVVEFVGFNCANPLPILSAANVSGSHVGRGAPAKDQAKDSEGNPIVLPIDADGSGVDEYLIVDKAVVAGKTWVALYIGGCQPVWLSLDEVTLTRVLP